MGLIMDSSVKERIHAPSGVTPVWFLKLVGRSSLVFDVLRRGLGQKRMWREGKSAGRNPDETGRVVSSALPDEILWDDGDVLFVRHGQLIHSFARAQEFSLLRRYKHFLKKPVLDLGCGDGSFASALFKEVDYGVDIDDRALRIAGEYGIYNVIIKSGERTIPLDDGRVCSIFSNSVLEHLNEMESILSESNRVLVHGGILMFTVPVKQYERDLLKYFGRSASIRVNRESFHRNLLEPDEWKRLLHKVGFEVVSVQPYQPDWFTFWYRMLRLFGKRGLPAIFPGIADLVWKMYGAELVEMVRKSISETTIGGNILVVARKR